MKDYCTVVCVEQRLSSKDIFRKEKEAKLGIKEKIENAKVTNWLTNEFSKKEIESIRKSAKKKVANRIIKENNV